MEKKIEVFGRKLKTKDGKEFMGYRAKKADGKLIDTRFTKEVNVPRTSTHFYIVVDDSKCNVSNSGVYPVLWVKEVKSFEEIIPNSSLSDFE